MPSLTLCHLIMAFGVQPTKGEFKMQNLKLVADAIGFNTHLHDMNMDLAKDGEIMHAGDAETVAAWLEVCYEDLSGAYCKDLAIIIGRLSGEGIYPKGVTMLIKSTAEGYGIYPLTGGVAASCPIFTLSTLESDSGEPAPAIAALNSLYPNAYWV